MKTTQVPFIDAVPGIWAALAKARSILASTLRWACLALVAGVVACGGGGDASSPPPDVVAALTVQPASQAAVSGSVATFSVTATGSTLSFQWQRSTNGAASWTDIAGAIAASYSLAAVNSSMNGYQFRVVVRSGTAITTSAAATLTVTSPPAPVITTSPTDQAATVGGSVTFSAAATGSSVTFQWQASADGGATWSDVGNATSATLVLTPLALVDSGRRFRVTASNDGGTATSAAAVLTVTAALAAPTLTTQPLDASVTATRTATFAVAASGNPAPTYQWQSSSDGGTIYTSIAGAASASYTTPTLVVADSGTRYRVIVSNAQGSATSNAATLTVTAATGPGFTQAVLSMSTTTCVAKTDGTALCWGSSDGGQVDGTPRFTARTPVPVPNLSGVVAVATGFGHSCAVKSNGTVACWGTNTYGELGGGQRVGGFREQFAPTAVTSLIDGQAIVAGHFYTCALRSAGTVACWGYNGSGELGDGTSSNRISPTTIPGLSDVVALDAGETHTCALRSNGTVACWGNNASGQLGDGTTTLRRSPTTVAGLSDAVAVTAGDAHTCALRANGTVVCWGYDASGATGNLAAALSPRAVTGLANVAALAASNTNTCALKADGSVACWGSGSGLGTGPSQSNTLSPVSVPSLNNVVALSGGWADMCAVKTDSTLHCWGTNVYAQIGDGTQNPAPTPQPVAGVTVLLR